MYFSSESTTTSYVSEFILVAGIWERKITKNWDTDKWFTHITTKVYISNPDIDQTELV